MEDKDVIDRLARIETKLDNVLVVTSDHENRIRWITGALAAIPIPVIIAVSAWAWPS